MTSFFDMVIQSIDVNIRSGCDVFSVSSNQKTQTAFGVYILLRGNSSRLIYLHRAIVVGDEWEPRQGKLE